MRKIIITTYFLLILSSFAYTNPTALTCSSESKISEPLINNVLSEDLLFGITERDLESSSIHYFVDELCFFDAGSDCSFVNTRLYKNSCLLDRSGESDYIYYLDTPLKYGRISDSGLPIRFYALGSFYSYVNEIQNVTVRGKAVKSPESVLLALVGILSYLSFINLRKIGRVVLEGVKIGISGVRSVPRAILSYFGEVNTFLYESLSLFVKTSDDDFIYGRHSVPVGFAGLLKKIASSFLSELDYNASNFTSLHKTRAAC